MAKSSPRLAVADREEVADSAAVPSATSVVHPHHPLGRAPFVLVFDQHEPIHAITISALMHFYPMKKHRMIQPNELISVLDGDCLIAIFVSLYSRRLVHSAISFIQTCVALRKLFAEAGKSHYCEARAMFRTRMPISGISSPFPYTVQYAREGASKRHIHGFYKACEMMAMHCATECCKANRLEYNKVHGKKTGKLTPISTGVRLVASASETDVHFIYAREQSTIQKHNSRKPIHQSVLRACTSTKNSKTHTVLLLDDYKPLLLVPSPDGKFCAFTVFVEQTIHLLVWDVHAGNIRTMLNKEALVQSGYHPQCVWWATDPETKEHHLLSAWHERYFDDMGTLMVGATQHTDVNTSLSVVDYGVCVPFNNPTLLVYKSGGIDPRSNDMSTQKFRRMTGNGWNLAVMITTMATFGIANNQILPYDRHCSHIFVVSCDKKDKIKYLCTYNPNVYYPMKSLCEDVEVVHGNVSLALSPNGMHVAVLAQNYKWRCYTPHNALCLVLYTWDDKSQSYIRLLGAKDEVQIPMGANQTRKGWEISFSSCGAFIVIVYARNRFYTPLVTTSEASKSSAIHFVHLGPTGIRRAQPSACPSIRQVSWTHTAMLVAPKHGAVVLT